MMTVRVVKSTKFYEKQCTSCYSKSAVTVYVSRLFFNLCERCAKELVKGLKQQEEEGSSNEQ